MEIQISDQEALSFLTKQAAHIESEVYEIQYEDLTYNQLVSIDTSASEYAKSIEFYSMDKSGGARWITHKGDDVPLVNVNMNQHQHNIEMAAAGYEYTTWELGYAQRLGISLEADRAAVVRRASEEFLDDLAKVGDTDKGFEGLFNSTAVGTAAAGTTIQGSTPDQIAQLFNANLNAINETSRKIEMADTVLLPLAAFNHMATTRMSTGGGDGTLTVLDYVRAANVYTATTGQPLTIMADCSLDDVGGDTRMVFYRNNREVVKMHMPMPLRFLDVWKRGPMHYMVPAYFRTGGVEIRRPGAFRYITGV